MRKTFENFANALLLSGAFLAGGGANSLRAEVPQEAKITVTGVVSDAEGPVIGASVTEAGNSGNGTATDVEGKYSLRVSPSATIAVAYLGYSTQELPVNGQTTINVTLAEDAANLEEVVVVGYGTQKKVNLTGAVTQITSEKLEARPVTTISAALQGQMPGVTVVQSSGQPGGDGGTIRIRGIGTMNNANPLVIVDGLEAKMDDINPTDIASVSVLKDAASAAIYGARAANGVILITTKRGTKAGAKVTYNGYVGWQASTDLPKLLSSYDYVRLINAAADNDRVSRPFSDEAVEWVRTGTGDPDLYGETDWLKEIMRGSGMQQSHSVNVAGGSENVSYMLSVGYLKQEGLTEKTSFERFNTRLNLDAKVNSRLNVGTNLALSYSDKIAPRNDNGGLSSVVSAMYRIPPTNPVEWANGSGYAKFGDGNPAAFLRQGSTDRTVTPHINGSTYAELAIIDGLKLRGSVGVDYNFDDRKEHVLPTLYGNRTTGAVTATGRASVRDYQTRYLRTTLQSMLTYNKTFAEVHNLGALLGVSRESYNQKVNEAYRRDQPSNDLNQVNAGVSDGSQDAKGYETDMRQGSVFGRVTYDYKGRYLLEANVRRDGSSRFRSGNRWGTFPSFSAGYRISEESYFEPAKQYVNNLKLRGSWGQLGNDRVDNYLYFAKIKLTDLTYPFDDDIYSGAAQTDGSNQDITWETATEVDFGVDVGLFNNKLDLSVDWYSRTTSDILVEIPVSSVYGLKAPTVNAGEMLNSGIEAAITHRNTLRLGGRDFGYEVGANFAYNHNEVTKFPRPAIGDQIKKEGEAWNSWYGYETMGFYQKQEQLDNLPRYNARQGLGDFIYKNQNDDDKIDANDRVVLGSPQPAYTVGLNLGVQYFGFDVSAFFQGAFDVYYKYHQSAMFAFLDGRNTGQEKMLNYWTPTNTNAVWPSPHMSSDPNNIVNSFTVLNTSYLRMKNLQVGYTIPQRLLSNLGIEKLRIYFSGQNMLTFKAKILDGIDPEVSSPNYTYPNVATHIFGLDITF
ncbi:SusC/RagA family TonB-linked outer membrane protein [Bacteroidia bacterium]|nr:SusC/RagA family TonB-linked outer membrane protein [Bacteroidia bacterium]